jgi:hypothetical protein
MWGGTSPGNATVGAVRHGAGPAGGCQCGTHAMMAGPSAGGGPPPSPRLTIAGEGLGGSVARAARSVLVSARTWNATQAQACRRRDTGTHASVPPGPAAGPLPAGEVASREQNGRPAAAIMIATPRVRRTHEPLGAGPPSPPAQLSDGTSGTPTRYIVGIYHVYIMYIPRGGILVYLVYPRY